MTKDDHKIVLYFLIFCDRMAMDGIHPDGTVPQLEGSEPLKIAFIGAGKVGTNLARYFAESGLDISGFFVRKNHSTDDLRGLMAASDIVFITVNDDSVEPVVKRISELGLPLEGKSFGHTCGSLSVAVLKPLKDLGASVFACHPLQTFSSRAVEEALLKEMHFFVENPQDPHLKMIFDSLPNPLHEIKSEDKVKYHLGASIMANLTMGLMDFAFDLIEEIGVDKESGFEAFKPLLRGTCTHLLEEGPGKALTGPLKRGDQDTIEKHLAVLKSEDRELYRLLALKTLNLVEPGPGTTKIKKLLKEGGNNG
jgi:predicted short-subunit dehydrogenase-like oxidoreductase (DUF2520 family)